MLEYKASDGTRWGVEVDLPGSSNAMVIFRHPNDGSRGRDRYNWFLAQGPEARSVTTRLHPKKVLEMLDVTALDRLFRRSMPISRPPSGAPEPAPA
jgi:hypothetical protein